MTRVACAAAMLALALSPGMAPTALADPGDTPECPYRVTTPPAVDASEVPRPGMAPPPPLPVPASPVGGPALAGCGLVTATDNPPVPADISAESWLVADMDTGSVIAARDPHGRHRPASIVKVLTAMAAINQLDLAKPVVGTEEDAAADGTQVGVAPGGVFTVRDLLHGLLMGSGNDAAHALAVQLGDRGGYDAGMAAINRLAVQLGSSDTRVATPSGLDGPGMSTSAYDMALFYRYAWADPTFAEIAATRTFDFPGHDEAPGYLLENDNRLLSEYPGAMGGKTGYTDDAGQTFVGAAQRDGRRLLVVLLHGTRLPLQPWEQAARLLDYGFATGPEVRVGNLIEPDPALLIRPDSAGPVAPLEAHSALAPTEVLPVRVGVAVIGTVVVFMLMLGARAINQAAPNRPAGRRGSRPGVPEPQTAAL